LELWLKLTEIPSVHLWSLCPGEDAQKEIVSLGAEALVLDEVTKFSDFAETAAFIDQLDLVISVDTAVAHLAASMGKPTWMLSQFTPCWRWWGLAEGTGRPWYDSMETLAQHAPGDWKSQLEECERRLRQMVLVGQRMAA
jgi:ADP-heptose:LPS heptosyltransferase